MKIEEYVAAERERLAEERLGLIQHIQAGRQRAEEQRDEARRHACRLLWERDEAHRLAHELNVEKYEAQDLAERFRDLSDRAISQAIKLLAVLKEEADRA